MNPMAAIFADKSLATMVGSASLKKITFLGNATYFIETENCSLQVILRNSAKAIPGFIGNGNYEPVISAFLNDTCNN